MNWIKYALKRLLMLIPVIFCVTLILYVILSLAPNGLARQKLGQDASEEQIYALEEEMGLHDPIIVRYAKYMADAIRMDFGQSWINGNDVLSSFAIRC